MSYNVDKISKLAHIYYEQADNKITKEAELTKVAEPITISVVLGVGTKILAVWGALAAISTVVNAISSTEGDIPKDTAIIIERLNSYEKSYTFGAYEKDFREFKKVCEKLQSYYSIIKSMQDLKQTSEQQQLVAAENIQNFFSCVNDFQTLAPSIIKNLNEMRNPGGKFLDFLSNIGIAAHKIFQTDTVVIREHVQSLNNAIAEQIPKIKSLVKENAISPDSPLLKEKEVKEPAKELKEEDEELTKDDERKISQFKEVADAGSILLS